MTDIRPQAMRWTIDYDGAMEVIRTTVSGDMNAEGLKAMTLDLLVESQRRDNYRVLCDCRHASSGIDASEIYRDPGHYRELGLMSYHMVALLHAPALPGDSLFSLLEERCQTSGLNVKAFTDNDQAVLWLTGIDWSTNSHPLAVEA
jgi:hypothetical protein